ncbi:unnamed protein product [Durusdinium trenchii]|uniref:Endonuclease/exonuclease/phosphatase domain-containing protein n=1 Tax=Durusdinium trenchii TaxID=1381693 RepID=A0ABP0SKC5_9DINO
MKLLECSRHQPWSGSKGEQVCTVGGALSVLSWNVLAPSTAEGTEIFRRERLPALLEVLDLYTSCDIICLQEVEIGAFLQPVRDFLEERGFETAVQEREGHTFVNVTFFHHSLRLSWSMSRSRIFLTGFLMASGHEVCVVNVHLDSKKEDQRASQLSKSLQKMSQKRSTFQVVCGDFNTDLSQDIPLTEMLAEYGLSRAPMRGLTHTLGGALDHLCSTRGLAPRRVLCAASRSIIGVRATGKGCPSDHLPVACEFEILEPLWQCPRMTSAAVPADVAAEWAELLELGTRTSHVAPRDRLPVRIRRGRSLGVCPR